MPATVQFEWGTIPVPDDFPDLSPEQQQEIIDQGRAALSQGGEKQPETRASGGGGGWDDVRQIGAMEYLGNSYTLGAVPWAADAISAGIDSATSDEGFFDAYDKRRAQTRKEIQRYRRDNTGAAIATDLGAAVLPGPSWSRPVYGAGTALAKQGSKVLPWLTKSKTANWVGRNVANTADDAAVAAFDAYMNGDDPKLAAGASAVLGRVADSVGALRGSRATNEVDAVNAAARRMEPFPTPGHTATREAKRRALIARPEGLTTPKDNRRQAAVRYARFDNLSPKVQYDAGSVRQQFYRFLDDPDLHRAGYLRNQTEGPSKHIDDGVTLFEDLTAKNGGKTLSPADLQLVHKQVSDGLAKLPGDKGDIIRKKFETFYKSIPATAKLVGAAAAADPKLARKTAQTAGGLERVARRMKARDFTVRDLEDIDTAAHRQAQAQNAPLDVLRNPADKQRKAQLRMLTDNEVNSAKALTNYTRLTPEEQKVVDTFATGSTGDQLSRWMSQLSPVHSPFNVLTIAGLAGTATAGATSVWVDDPDTSDLAAGTALMFMLISGVGVRDTIRNNVRAKARSRIIKHLAASSNKKKAKLMRLADEELLRIAERRLKSRMATRGAIRKTTSQLGTAEEE